MDNNSLQQMRRFAESAATMPCAFRLAQLKALRQALMNHEQEIYEAMYQDLRKSETESFLTEYGLVMVEIRLAIKKLASWMHPKRVKTGAINFPSSSWIYPYPKGVVLIIGTWNYPVLLNLAPLIGAIAAGNCVVVKPSEHAPATATVIEKIISAVFPANYIRVVQGDGSRVVPELMQTFRFDHIFYTGSGTAGKKVYELAAKDLIPVTLELGGKNPAVIESDAAIESAARRIVFGKFTNAGQTCVAPDYLLVHATLEEAMIAALKKTILAAFSDSPQASADWGRIINNRRFETLVALMESSNATLLHGGRYDAGDLYIEPTLLGNVALDSSVMQEEIFGPLLPVISFTSTEEAMSIINLHPNPLAFYLFTSSKKKEKEWLNRVSFGSGCINNAIQQLGNPQLPFGGVGQSGIGAYRGEYSFKTFTHYRAVMKTPCWFDLSAKYPPYGNRLKWLRKFY